MSAGSYERGESMSRVLGVLVAMTAGVAMLVASGAQANNDPHRFFAPYDPLDLPASVCGFPVHIEATVNREYAKVSSLPDGSTVYTFTGSLFAGVANANTGKAITVNASGPGTIVFSSDFTSAEVMFEGLSLLYATNLTDYGFPSNIVVTSGLLRGRVTETGTTGLHTVTNITRKPNVVLDVCAALAP